MSPLGALANVDVETTDAAKRDAQCFHLLEKHLWQNEKFKVINVATLGQSLRQLKNWYEILVRP